MRIIAGEAKGRILLGPKSDRIRPAIDKVKGAIFNILGNIEGKTVLDLFAGTGSVGIEALSRGAAHCTFVDSSREAIGLIRKNLERCGFITPPNPPLMPRLRSAHALRGGLPDFLRRIFGTFDLIFVDPPYDKNLVNPTLRAIAAKKALAPGGIVVVEHSPREPVREGFGLAVYDRRKYGQTLISFLKESS